MAGSQIAGLHAALSSQLLQFLRCNGNLHACHSDVNRSLQGSRRIYSEKLTTCYLHRCDLELQFRQHNPFLCLVFPLAIAVAGLANLV